jgi:hypothetical protein
MIVLTKVASFLYSIGRGDDETILAPPRYSTFLS